VGDTIGEMTEEQQYKKLTRSRPKSNVFINASLVAGFVILIVCQLILFRFTTRQRTRIASSIQDGLGNTADVVSLASSAMQLVSCSDDDLSDAIATVRPAIVNIDVASSDVGPAGKKGGPALNFDMPPSGTLQANEETLGSGIIVDARGYVLTCYHLIKDYPKVYVTVLDANRKTYKADVIDVDIANDLALLRIYPDSPIPVARLANSDMVKITDTVLAIGSPFGFEHTVTGGIISDNKRSIVIGARIYHDLFQTDACVNRGSAGGALISSEGEVVGVNTAIASTSGYFAGISFAIPINKARPLLLKAIEGY